ncbi:Uu.00g134000.m01.CDS01 [Anthostomella pinea]|uniref:Uu.00g134000.m01.CDS01 n=1 Tax=Anthostomella pinea TaxID=933095 RepID=A0AAI8VNX8_9PEZI|nr:Uu.00g134000.m01.CDS01 [Anthostomella pinea]
MAIYWICPHLSKILQGQVPEAQVFPAKCEAITIEEARERGLSESMIEAISKRSYPQQPSAYIVLNVIAGQDRGLRKGDMLCQLDGRAVARGSDLAVPFTDVVEAKIVRDGTEHTVNITTLPSGDFTFESAVEFCGAFIRRPVLSCRLFFIAAVDGQETRDESELLDVAKTLEDKQEITLSVESKDGREGRISGISGIRSIIVQTNTEHFPTCQIVRAGFLYEVNIVRSDHDRAIESVDDI